MISRFAPALALVFLAATSSPAAAPEPAKKVRERAAVNAAEADAIVDRRRIERRLNDLAEELVRLRAEITDTPRVVGDDTRGVAVAAAEGENPQAVLDDVNVDLRAREQGLLGEIDELKAEFATLTERVERQHGGTLPPSWSRLPRCRDCP